jgi:hypothetical protein
MKKLNRERVQRLYINLQFEKVLPVIPYMMISDINKNDEQTKKEIYDQIEECINQMSNKQLYEEIKNNHPDLLEKYNEEFFTIEGDNNPEQLK